MTVEIFFNDLTEEKKKEVLELYKCENSEDGNFENLPLCILEYYGD